MSELQKRLREYGTVVGRHFTLQDRACSEAADALDAQAQEIERLTAELAQTQRDRQAEHDLRVTMQGEAETLRARLAEAERDAGRYRWLRTRINWCDQEDRYLNAVTRYRAWTHCDYRMNPPASEHIDEYIDAARGGA